MAREANTSDAGRLQRMIPQSDLPPEGPGLVAEDSGLRGVPSAVAAIVEVVPTAAGSPVHNRSTSCCLAARELRSGGLARIQGRRALAVRVPGAPNPRGPGRSRRSGEAPSRTRVPAILVPSSRSSVEIPRTSLPGCTWSSRASRAPAGATGRSPGTGRCGFSGMARTD